VLRILIPPAAFAAFAVFSIAFTNSTPAQAVVLRVGCSLESGCVGKCRSHVPGPEFQTLQACIDHWAPINRARMEAIKQAKAKAAAERAAAR
jgi:hypothetical protein